MRPAEHDEEAGGDSGSGSGSETEEEEALIEGGAAAALQALDALRKARQHYDALVLGGGCELPAHRALLAAASPYLLRLLPACGPGPEPLRLRVRGVGGGALKALVSATYGARLAVGGERALALYRAAWALRMESLRLALADRLARRPQPATVLAVRALPDLPDKHQDALDAYIDHHFDGILMAGAMALLPLLVVELVACSSAAGGEEAARAVASAALGWLKARHQATPLGALCARSHLAYVDAGGALRDCDELPEGQAGAAAIQEYRAAASQRQDHGAPADDGEEEDEEGGEGEVVVVVPREPRPEWRVVAARGGAGVTRALLLLGGRLAAARLAWRDVGAGVTQGGPLGGAREVAAGGERRAVLPGARAGAGAAVLGGRLLVLGGYDRTAVLRDAVAYCPATNRWEGLPPLRAPRARLAAAVLGDKLYVLGGSDGHNELDSVDVFSNGKWSSGGRLPLAVSQAGAAGDPDTDSLWLVGGWGGGRPLKSALVWRAGANHWVEGPALLTARSQVCCVRWEGALWAVGGCDAWHCLASTERLPLDAIEAGWQAGPALARPRRSVGGAAWRGQLLVAGGSDGACSLTRCERLPGGGAAGGWLEAPALRQPRAAPALLPLADVLYAVGGFDGKEFLSTVECLYEVEGEWTSLCAPPPAPLRPLPAPAPANDAAVKDPAQPSDDKANRVQDTSLMSQTGEVAAVNGDGEH